jgi:hypothetical protein
MRIHLVFATALLLADPLHSPAAEDPVLPAKIPGYELRALDVRKPIVINVNGTWVQAALPVFFYFPTPVPPQAIPLLRQIYDDLLKLGRQPEWTAAELQGVLGNLDTAIRILDQPAQDPSPKPKN